MGDRDHCQRILETHRAKGTLAVFLLAFITASIRQSCQVGGWQDILGNVVPVIQSLARDRKVEERIGKKTSQMAWVGRMQVLSRHWHPSKLGGSSAWLRQQHWP